MNPAPRPKLSDTADLALDWGWPLRCTNCGRGYPDRGLPARCPACGGVYDLAEPLRYLPPDRKRGLGRYRAAFPLPDDARLISLGEGDTPLLADQLLDRQVYLKCEYQSPTGSFKDRGTAVLVSALVASGVAEAVEDSSGNAGSSFAAYAAAAGIKASVYVPEYASGAKRAQIAAYGAELIPVPGPRSAAGQAVLAAEDAGAVYASHSHLPFGLAGYATIAFELLEQLGRAPGTLILPAGQGTLLLGVHRGFQALQAAGVTDHLPQMVAVQARACAPLWAVSTGGAAALGWVQEGETLAEGIRILTPLRGDAVLEAVERSGGRVLAVEEDQILAGREDLARRGFWVEPTSAVVWPALLQVLEEAPDPVVLILTGSGFKA